MIPLDEYLVDDINKVKSEDINSDEIVAITTVTSTGSHILYIRGDYFTKIAKFISDDSIYSRFTALGSGLKHEISNAQRGLVGGRKEKYVRIYMPSVNDAPYMRVVGLNNFNNENINNKLTTRYSKLEFDFEAIKDFLNEQF